MKYQTAFLAIATQDLETLVNFYQTLLENNPDPYIPNQYAEFQLEGGVKLGIFKPKDTHQNEFSQPQKSAMSLCIEVSNLDSAIAQLSALGYPPPGEVVTASHGSETYAYDSDGNRLILHCSSVQ